ncbi:MAG: GNAT family N-acetyltransferase [Candidatus Latescibacteria bacterium]|nr:GNAT family N-acetyltransferase [Candidatus Latescibacterota bacterium]
MQEAKKENLPQLRMGYMNPAPPAVEGVPAGYQLRPFQAGDEPGWMELLNANGELGEWSLERIAGILGGGLKNQFFAVCGGQLTACAGVHDTQLEGAEYWEIGWVASHPQHRGKGLGVQVTAAALGAALELPRRPIVLRTDDFRLPAIKVYLKLGFVPLLDHPSYPERWRLIHSRLGPGSEVRPPGASA